MCTLYVCKCVHTHAQMHSHTHVHSRANISTVVTCCDKHHGQKPLGGTKGFTSSSLLGHHPSLKEVRTGTWRQEPWRRTLSTSGSLIRTCLASFLTQQRPTCLGMGCSRQQLAEFSIINQDLAIGQFGLRSSSTEVPSFQVTLGCVKLAIKTNQHTH